MHSVAIVTGAKNGIGKATCEALVAAGYRVAGIDTEWDGPAEGDSSGLMRIRGDVADLGTWQAARDTVIEDYGRLDLVVNNAYVHTARAARELTETEWEREMGVCLKAVYLSVKTCVGDLLEFRGCVVNVASVQVYRGHAGYFAYAAAKGGVCAVTRQLAVEYGPRLRINAVLPGPIATRAWQDVGIETIRRTARGTCLGRLGEPREVASAIVFLASEGASFITGAELVVDGGLMVNEPD